jgi:hypothetical protein
MGTCDELALDVLINSFMGYSRDLAGLRRIVVGGANRDWPLPESPEDDESEAQVHGSVMEEACVESYLIWSCMKGASQRHAFFLASRAFPSPPMFTYLFRQCARLTGRIVLLRLIDAAKATDIHLTPPKP